MPVIDYDDGTRIIQEVPVYYQGNTSTCAQACVAGVLNYWGYNVNYNEIIYETSNSDMSVGMTPERIVWYFRRYNLQAKSYKGNLDNLKNLVDQGLPAIVAFDERDTQHVVVVVGYNDYRGVIFYNDSMYGELTEEPYSDFVRAWGRQRLTSTRFADDIYNNLIIQVNR
jgi:ABC-type bacteriocin/lantibiotic exporter with double-glycine peptidase domain